MPSAGSMCWYGATRAIALDSRRPKIVLHGGEALNDSDLKFLQRALSDARDLNPILERNPEYLDLRNKAVGLLEQILAQDAQNQSS